MVVTKEMAVESLKAKRREERQEERRKSRRETLAMLATFVALYGMLMLVDICF